MAGQGVMLEMVNELWSSYAQGQMFEGDMLRLTQVGYVRNDCLSCLQFLAAANFMHVLLLLVGVGCISTPSALLVLSHSSQARSPLC